MFPLPKALTILAPALLLSGCGGTVNRGLEPVHQAIVQRTDFALDVATAPDGLATGEDARLAGWLASLRLGYGDRLTIDVPSVVSQVATRAAVARIAAPYGLLVTDDTPITSGDLAEGTARVIVSRSKASVPGCPDWSRMGASDFAANTSSNFGCAMNATMAAMIARPEDLVRGQPGTDTPDPMIMFKAIDVFRKTPPTGAQGIKPETSKAN